MDEHCSDDGVLDSVTSLRKDSTNNIHTGIAQVGTVVHSRAIPRHTEEFE